MQFGLTCFVSIDGQTRDIRFKSSTERKIQTDSSFDSYSI